MEKTVSEALAENLAFLESTSPQALTLRALAMKLANQIDVGQRNGMALPALSKELRLVLEALTESEKDSDEFSRFLADMST